MRVFTETGKLGAPSFAARISALACSGFFIRLAPAPCFSTLLSGQPMLMSMPSKSNSAARTAAAFMCSGAAVKNCATTGRSASVYLRSSINLRFPSVPARARPSAETNSVHMTSGLPYLAMTRRYAASVTFAIGASAKMGFSSFSQKLFINLKSLILNLLLEPIEYFIFSAQVESGNPVQEIFLAFDSFVVEKSREISVKQIKVATSLPDKVGIMRQDQVELIRTHFERQRLDAQLLQPLDKGGKRFKFAGRQKGPAQGCGKRSFSSVDEIDTAGKRGS